MNNVSNILSSVSKLSLRKGDIIIIYQDNDIETLMTAFNEFAKENNFKERKISVWLLPTSTKVEKFSRKELMKYKLNLECNCGKTIWKKLKEFIVRNNTKIVSFWPFNKKETEWIRNFDK